MILWLTSKYKKYFQCEPKFNGFCLRNNLAIIKDGAYEKSLDEFESIRTHWIALYANGDNVTVFIALDSFVCQWW